MISNEKDNLRDKLNSCTSLEDMLKAMLLRYDLSSSLGLISKPLIIQALLKAYDMIKPKLK